MKDNNKFIKNTNLLKAQSFTTKICEKKDIELLNNSRSFRLRQRRRIDSFFINNNIKNTPSIPKSSTN